MMATRSICISFLSPKINYSLDLKARYFIFVKRAWPELAAVFSRPQDPSVGSTAVGLQLCQSKGHRNVQCIVLKGTRNNVNTF